MNAPLRQILQKPDLTGYMTKCILELSKYHIDFQLRKTIQAQILADFIVENTLLSPTLENQQQENSDPEIAWSLYIDGSTGTDHQGVGIILKSPTGIEFVYALKYYFPINNSESEYEALLSGLRMALAMNMDQLTTHGDSQIVYGHVTRTFEVREDNMKKYSTLARKFVSRFKRT